MKQFSILLFAIVITLSSCQASKPVSSNTNQQQAQKTIIIYTMNSCYYCQKAKKLLDEKNIPHMLVDIFSKPGLFDEISGKSGVKTVPQVFINNEFWGGYKDLVLADMFGDLRENLLS
ncbi:MAG TPA: glutaredoxin domain-containing protein [Candidatus Nitrosotenuis sp.]|nr:glutaredoxin domain-containing protein [Candidatus Nitrosotenuis sp.]